MLYIPQTLTNPEVRIQIRLERYPNRKVDFSKSYYSSFSYSVINIVYNSAYMNREAQERPLYHIGCL